MDSLKRGKCMWTRNDLVITILIVLVIQYVIIFGITEPDCGTI